MSDIEDNVLDNQNSLAERAAIERGEWSQVDDVVNYYEAELAKLHEWQKKANLALRDRDDELARLREALEKADAILDTVQKHHAWGLIQDARNALKETP